MTAIASPRIPTGDERGRLAPAARAARILLRLVLVGLLLLPFWGFLAGDTLAARLALVALFGLTLARPHAGLLVAAAFLPIAGHLGLLFHFQSPAREALLVAFLAGWLLRETLSLPRADAGERRLVTPALLFAAVAAASLSTRLLVQEASEAYVWSFFRQMAAHLASGKDAFDSSYAGLYPAMTIFSGVAFFVAAVRLGRPERSRALAIMRMATVGGVAVAAINVSRFAYIWLRDGGSGRSLVELARTMRITTVFADVNATGSYLAMIVVLSAGFACARSRARGPWWVATAVAVAALWLTGSRAAFAATPIAAVLVFVWFARVRRFWSGRLVAAAVAAILVAVVLAAWLFPRDTTNRELPLTIQWRVGQAQGAVRAFLSSPLFGVGVGRFWEVSGSYFSESLRQKFPRENAHNNYLQILAELGLAGFVPFLWILGAAARRIVPAAAGDGGVVFAAAAAGTIAFLVTCLAGHPLLIAPVSDGFWLILGSLSALALAVGTPQPAPVPSPESGTSAVARNRRDRRHRTYAIAAVVALAVSVPIRARTFIENEADLSRVVIGLSQKWSFDEQGVRYRQMTGRGEFYVPTDTCEVWLMLRAAPGGTPRTFEVALLVDGRLANRFVVVADAWRQARVLLRVDSGRRFRRLELRSSPAEATLWTGRPKIAQCGSNPF